MIIYTLIVGCCNRVGSMIITGVPPGPGNTGENYGKLNPSKAALSLSTAVGR
jgi:hypothetical protein